MTKLNIKLITLLVIVLSVIGCKTKSSDEGKTILKTLKLSILNDGKIDKTVHSKMEEEMEGLYKIVKKNGQLFCEGTTVYNYSHSDNTKRVLCDFTLQYEIIEVNGKKAIQSDTKKILGSGFSEKEAKRNAIDKLKL